MVDWHAACNPCPENPEVLNSDHHSLMADMLLADRVHSVLEKNPHVPHRNLRFETNAGHVVLKGVVRSYYQKQMAQEALLHIDGIEGIENQVEVRN